MLRTKLVSGVVLLALSLPALPARAAGPDEAAAEALFRSGKQLMSDRKYADACPKLAESFRLDAATGTLLALALCYEQWGKLASAWSSYATAADRSKQEGRIDREKAARKRASELEPKLSKLTISVDPAAAALAGLTVSRNGVTVGAASFGVPLPVDPEEISIEASAPDRKAWSTKVLVGPNADQKTVTVPPLEDVKKVSEAPPPPPPPPAAEPKPSGGSLTPMRIGAFAAGGAGILALGAGGFFGLRALSKNSESEDAGCSGNECTTEEGKKLRDDAISAGNAATVATIAGGVLVAAGVTLFVLDLNRKPAQPARGGLGARVAVAPAFGRGDAGLTVVGRF